MFLVFPGGIELKLDGGISIGYCPPMEYYIMFTYMEYCHIWLSGKILKSALRVGSVRG